mmetsp:Transcript_31295/g.40256  ORF Transcript_31295/g.40256 Transcript_31295/m.40256 type:complete len:520 (-) Transcript_31295:170-1729(-)
MEEIPEIGSPRFDLPLDVDDVDLLEVLLTDDTEEGLPNIQDLPSSGLENKGELSVTSSSQIPIIKTKTESESISVAEQKNQSKDVKFEIDGEDGEEPLSTDPVELKKQRRLIRNRMSAQLHRERKKAYIDKLEAEVKQRDSNIDQLNSRIIQLENENTKLRLQLSQCDSCRTNITNTSSQSSCLQNNIPILINDNSDFSNNGFSTHEESCDSDGSSQGSKTPPPRKRSLSDSFSNNPKRFLPGSLLASLACLFCFQSSFFNFSTGISPSTAFESSSSSFDSSSLPIRSGRVLFSIEDISNEDVESNTLDEINKYEDGDSETSFVEKEDNFALVTTPSKMVQSTPSSSQSIPIKTSDQGALPNNKSHHLFCPTTFQYSSNGVVMPEWPDSLNKSQFQSNDQEGQSDHHTPASAQKRRLRANPSRDSSSSMPHIIPILNSEKANAALEPINGGKSLVLHDSSTHNHPTQQHGDHYDDNNNFRELTLVVPSSSLEGFGSLEAHSNWLEIGCRMHSAKFIDFK